MPNTKLTSATFTVDQADASTFYVYEGKEIAAVMQPESFNAESAEHCRELANLFAAAPAIQEALETFVKDWIAGRLTDSVDANKAMNALKLARGEA